MSHVTVFVLGWLSGLLTVAVCVWLVEAIL